MRTITRIVELKQGIGLPPVWRATPTARTCRRFRCRVATHWAAPTKMFAREMISPPRRGRRLLSGSSIISLGTTIVAFPALPSCPCEYPLSALPFACVCVCVCCARAIARVARCTFYGVYVALNRTSPHREATASRQRYALAHKHVARVRDTSEILIR